VLLCVLAGGFLAVTGVYVVVVLGGGLLTGDTDAPNPALAVLATAIVAIGFEPVRTRLETAATRWVHGPRPTPYDVLSRFSEAVAGDTARMAQVLAEGTGAEWAQVWVDVGGRPELAAAWPADAAEVEGDDLLRVRSRDVTLGDERLGTLRIRERADAPLTPVEERLFEGLAAQAGLVLRNARLRAELARRAEDLQRLADELETSRRRLVDAQDAARRRLERDIHDGAQQHLVALVVNLRLAETLQKSSPERAAAVLEEQEGAVDDAIDTLVELSRGIYPKALAAKGVAAALRALVRTSAVPVAVVDHGIGRHPAELEAALYFSASEAVQNAVKHAGATRIEVELTPVGRGVRLVVRDDGAGFDASAVLAEGGLGTIRDRIEAVAGTLTVRRNTSGGTDVVAEVA